MNTCFKTSLEGCLALARASLKEALLVPGEGAAVQGPVLVGDLLLGLLLTQLWARGATVSPRGIIIVESKQVIQHLLDIKKTQHTVCSTR